MLGLRTEEEPLRLAEAIAAHGPDERDDTTAATDTEIGALLDAIRAARGPLVLVGNEIGLGVIPLGREVRAFVDALGRLNQNVAIACDRATLMAAWECHLSD